MALVEKTSIGNVRSADVYDEYRKYVGYARVRGRYFQCVWWPTEWSDEMNTKLMKYVFCFVRYSKYSVMIFDFRSMDKLFV